MKTKYKCLYEITGRIEDVATFLVPISELPKEPEPEPDKYLMDIECTKCGAKQSGVLTVNTTPPQRTWVELTRGEIESWELPDKPTVAEFAWFVETKVREKNT